MPSSYYTSVTSLSQSLLQSSVISINTNNISINHLMFPADETGGFKWKVESEKGTGELEQSKDSEGEAEQSNNEYSPTIELTDDEKGVLNHLKDNSPIELNELKEQTGLSNKKWAKAIKGLTKNKVARVEKTDAGLFVLRV